MENLQIHNGKCRDGKWIDGNYIDGNYIEGNCIDVKCLLNKGKTDGSSRTHWQQRQKKRIDSKVFRARGKPKPHKGGTIQY